jgi:hypothetical protein
MIEERRAFFCWRDSFQRIAEPAGASASPIPLHHHSHGLGSIKDAGVEPCTIRYQNAGFAVLVFDYRYFGKRSEYRGREKGEEAFIDAQSRISRFLGLV